MMSDELVHRLGGYFGRNVQRLVSGAQTDSLTDGSLSRIEIPPSGLRIQNLGEFSRVCLGRDDFSGLLPKGSTFLADACLAAFEFTCTSALADSNLFLRLEWNSGCSWEIFPGLASKNPGLLLSSLPGESWHGELFGIVSIGDLDVLISVVLPSGEVDGGLVAAKGVRLKSLLDRYHLDSRHFEDLMIEKLVLGADAPDKILSFDASAANVWKAAGAHDPAFELREIRLRIIYVCGPAGFTNGSAIAKAELGGVDIELSARNDGPDQGWQFEGSAAQQQPIPIGHVLEDLGRKFGIATDLPKPIESLELKDLAVSFNTRSKNFTFRCTCDFEIAAGKKAEIAVDVNLVSNPAGGFDKHLSGKLLLGEGSDALEFDLIFDSDPVTTAFLATYSNPGGRELSVGKLVTTVTGETIDGLDNLKIGLKSALFACDKPATGPAKCLFALDMDAGVELARLPLVGKLLPAGETLRLVFEPLVATGDFTAQELATLKALLPPGAPALPAAQLDKGLHLLASLRIGGETIPLELPVALDKDTGNVQAAQPAAGNGAQAPASRSVPALPGGQTPGPDGVHWIGVHKTVGPVTFAQVGLKLDLATETFGVLIDAGLRIAGLDLTVQGLGASYSLKTKELDFFLHGLGLDYRQGPLEIAGAFLHLGDDFAGKALIRTEALAISALGAFALPEGQPSLFVYAFLDEPLGGPSFFFVEGLGLGFGYNRSFQAPPVQEVSDFPMVQEAMGFLGETDLTTELTRLHKYIAPSVGQYFLVAGLKFSTFKVVDSFALLAVSFGRHFEIDLLGVSTVTMPTKFPVDQALGAAVLDVVARFDPDEGYLGVQAQLDEKRSFLLSRDCHLHGGFALAGWFKGEHAGDFVCTLGGYHPRFPVPKHYPKVPRVGFAWQVSPKLSVKGDGYFALTPSVAMAGVSLEAVWESGSLRASYDTSANFLVSWKPYHYEAGMSVEIGAKYKCFSTHADADLEIWGPEFSGHAHIHWTVFSFDIRFGGSSPGTAAISWDSFYESFLPKPEEICSVTAAGGLVRTLDAGGGKQRWVINPKELRLTTGSVIPSKQGKADAADLAGGVGTAELGIAPMDLKAAGFKTSTHTIRIVRLRPGGEDPAAMDFRFEPVVKSFPSALWGQSKNPGDNLGARTLPALAGYEIVPRTPVQPFVSCPIVRRDLTYEVTDLPMGEDPSRPRAGYAAGDLRPETRTDDAAEREALRRDLGATHERRRGLLAALGFEPATAVDLSDSLADAFVVPPRRIASGPVLMPAPKPALKETVS
jgi:hypothetical protein